MWCYDFGSICHFVWCLCYLNGHISPGGGFSGGAIIGGGLMLYALAFGHEKYQKSSIIVLSQLSPVVHF
ncbi:MAG: MnhB domain-containing protein [Acutalibacteraceae bacterium]